ncbi:MAG TPA: hypothetical protein VFC56_04885 [Stellaceae bacterium]|nr:hypothetical protein [Stellaceae bacterium]
MDHEDDIERLFSWLQTPELRYREFAGAREITDAAVTSPPYPDTAGHAIPAGEPLREVEPGEYTDEPVAPVTGTRGSSDVSATPPAPPGAPGLLGGAYREGGQPAAGETGSTAEPPAGSADSRQGNERSLDVVFGRLSDARDRLPDPRERPRQIPGSRRPGDRSR